MPRKTRRASLGRADGTPRRRARIVQICAISITTALAWSACRPEGPANEGSLLAPDPDGTVSITLAWDPPQTDAEGNPLDDLAGYRLYFGQQSPLDASRDTFVEVGLEASRTLTGLSPGTYYFATSAVDTAGNESALSDEVGAELTSP